MTGRDCDGFPRNHKWRGWNPHGYNQPMPGGEGNL